jgi:hypothetical protein
MKCHRLLIFLLLLSFGCGGGGSGPGAGGITVTVLPGSDTLFPGSWAVFRATVAGSANQAVTWAAVGGTITQNGVYHAPASTGSFKVRAISQADPTKFTDVNISVIPSAGITVSITPPSPTVAQGSTQQFTADVVGTAPGVRWFAINGSITSGGLYTAPNLTGPDIVIARSLSNPSASAMVQVNVGTQGVGVTISPLNPEVGTRESVQMTAVVSNASNTSVNWSATAGTIDTNGLYTAPANPGTYDIRATSVQDPTKFATTQVVVKPIILTISPLDTASAAGDTTVFTASISGPSNTNVTWSASGGSISQSGVYTAPLLNGVYTITATSVANPLVSASTTLTVEDPISIFYDELEATPPPNGDLDPWRYRSDHSQSPSGRRFLGLQNEGQDLGLQLFNLPSHRAVRVTFDIYIVGDWRNDHITLSVQGGATRNTLGFSNISGFSQSYPNGGSNPPGTGRTEENVLGYNGLPGGFGGLFFDTTYRLSATFAHTDSYLRFNWEGELPRPHKEMVWGIDNVRVEYFP